MATYEKTITFQSKPTGTFASGASSPSAQMPLIEILCIDDIYLVDVEEIKGP